MVYGGLAMESAPNTGSLQASCLVLFATSTLLSVTEKLIQLRDLGLTVFTATTAQASDLVVTELIVR